MAEQFSEQWKATSTSSVTLVTVGDSAVMSRRRGVGVGAIKKRAEDAKAFASTGKKNGRESGGVFLDNILCERELISDVYCLI